MFVNSNLIKISSVELDNFTNFMHFCLQYLFNTTFVSDTYMENQGKYLKFSKQSFTGSFFDITFLKKLKKVNNLLFIKVLSHDDEFHLVFIIVLSL